MFNLMLFIFSVQGKDKTQMFIKFIQEKKMFCFKISYGWFFVSLPNELIPTTTFARFFRTISIRWFILNWK